ncbi:putative palmitoyl-protein thioesterase [Schistosoma mansoni]|uniref:putative palmitoyl-protein thioesterase n=1 Tax=Schistosoma mansoni TaxID=6183 RepID=UPI00022DC3B6|nr:putative palmitoyl-protein thioesterase [Schistosoma mansoni]|eukprot:XP_018653778.1 putative palmitoyl-protein thioesterase [Schistosoma mansoni]
MGLVAQMIKRAIPGTYVKSISTNSFAKEDVRDTVFRSINEQLDYVCGMIHKDKKLSNGFHMIGISQGGLLVRALAQKCNFSNVGTVVSIGGLQQENSAFSIGEVYQRHRRTSQRIIMVWILSNWIIITYTPYHTMVAHQSPYKQQDEMIVLKTRNQRVVF